MLVLRGPALTASITDPAIRSLVERRFTEILDGEPYDYDRHGYMIVVQPGDSVEALEKECGCDIFQDSFGESHYGDPDFAPCFESLEEHSNCYELLLILTDSFGVGMFIPKTEGIDILLLAFCAHYAARTTEPTSP